ncbi:COR domain-containing protein, partial [Acaryochloris marina NIES-2412]|uniref:COR domain-containing protein n=1 Tax=Acaryochloris marina TaxID=155978 RepID=UPI004059D667
VPPELAQLNNLTLLYLSDNQLSNIPPEVLAQGTPVILEHLREQLHAGQPQWISKLLVVGEGGVGKTSLLRALRHEPFDTAESTTHGIEIQTLNLQHPQESGVTMQLNTWDFGGQEIYHATHQFFLTNRSLFVLVWNARLGFEQGKLTYWLKTIRANAPDSPILIVATHIDERDADLPFSDFQQQFPQIVGQCAISNKKELGIAELCQAITNAAAALPLMGEIWPATWLQAATAIRNLPTTHKCISPNQLWQLMSEQQVKQKHHAILAKWLHELGDILFFVDSEDLNDLVILKPQWVTEYISKVL